MTYLLTSHLCGSVLPGVEVYYDSHLAGAPILLDPGIYFDIHARGTVCIVCLWLCHCFVASHYLSAVAC